MESTHMGYDVPPGPGHVLQVDTNQYLRDVRFIFGGPPKSLRITRIVGKQGCYPNIRFYDSNPHELTVFFAQNPLTTVLEQSICVVVDNLSDSTQSLQISVLGEIHDGVVPLGCVMPDPP